MLKRRLMTGLLLSILVAVLGVSASASAGPANFRAHLSGGNEVPPVDSNATGQAIFQLNPSGDELSFKLIVANIDDIVQAHIHCGAEGVNGPVVAFLFGPEPDGVDVNGILSQGVVTSGDVIPRPDSEACPGGVANFDEMIDKIMSGDAYVNVHTVENPGGEVRGQIR